MINGMGGLSDSGPMTCPAGESLNAIPQADGSNTWECVPDAPECDAICQAANAPTIDGFTCPNGYSVVAIADGTKNCVPNGQPTGCPAGQAMIPSAIPFVGSKCVAVTGSPAPIAPWYRRPVVLLGIVAALGGGFAFYARTRKMPHGL
jgi:hypothetical protein